MASNDAFWEKYRDPRWQKVRLEVMEEADFACEDCGTTDKTLNVHHDYYERGKDPWEYPLESLHCLCEDCHKNNHALLAELKRQLSLAGSGGYLEQTIGFVYGIRLMNDVRLELKLAPFPDCYEICLGIASYWQLDFNHVITLVDKNQGRISGQDLNELLSLEQRSQGSHA